MGEFCPFVELDWGGRGGAATNGATPNYLPWASTGSANKEHIKSYPSGQYRQVIKRASRCQQFFPHILTFIEKGNSEYIYYFFLPFSHYLKKV